MALRERRGEREGQRGESSMAQRGVTTLFIVSREAARAGEKLEGERGTRASIPLLEAEVLSLFSLSRLSSGRGRTANRFVHCDVRKERRRRE